MTDHSTHARLRHVVRCDCGAWIWIPRLRDGRPTCPHLPIDLKEAS